METPREDCWEHEGQALGPQPAVRLCDAGEAERLVGLLEEIAAELSWTPGTQLRDDAPRAVHFAAYRGSTLAGGMQLVPPAPGRPLPCERVWPDARLPRPDRTAHIAVLAVRRQHRGAGLLWPLCAAMWRHCAMSGIIDISLEVTPQTRRLYERLGWPLEVVGDLRRHWGEDCLLCRMGVAEVAGAMAARALRSNVYRGVVGMMTRPWHDDQAVEDPAVEDPALNDPAVEDPASGAALAAESPA